MRTQVNEGNESQTMRMLWVHGWGTGPWIWESLMREALSDHEHTFFSYAGCDDLVSMKERLNQMWHASKPDVVVGWSLGGMLVLEQLLAELRASAESGLLSVCVKERLTEGEKALEHGGRAMRIVLVSSTRQFTTTERTRGFPRKVIERMRARLAVEPLATVAQFHVQLFSDEEREQMVQQTAGQQAQLSDWTDFSVEGLDAGLLYLRDTDLREGWEQLRQAATARARVPRIAWLHGTADAICPVQAAPELGEVERLLLLNGAGHAPFVTETERCVQWMKGWLRDE